MRTDLGFIIKDYLLDNDFGYSNELDNDNELFHNVDVTSGDTILRSLKRAELEINETTLKYITDSGIAIDWSANWYNLYANCEYNGDYLYIELVLVCENKQTAEQTETPISISKGEKMKLGTALIMQLEEDSADYKKELQHIKCTADAAMDLKEDSEDSLVVTNFGSLGVKIKIEAISLNLFDEEDENEIPAFNIKVYASQPTGKLLPESKLFLGEVCVDNDDLVDVLKEIAYETCELKPETGKEITVAKAMKQFEAKQKQLER